METKKLSFEEMEMVEGGSVPKWVECGAAVIATGLFLGGLFATTGPLGLYAANAILGPTVSGIAIASCAT